MTVMKITIDPQVCKAHGLTVGELLYIMVVGNHIDLKEAAQSLNTKGLATTRKTKALSPFFEQPTQQACDLYDQIIMESDQGLEAEDTYLPLANKLIELYPQGFKDGKYAWTEGPILVARRLRMFEKKYGKYSDEDIVEATKVYVENKMFQPEMRILKYFIFKERENSAGEVEGTSDLYTMLEAIRNGELFTTDWTVVLRD